MTHFGNFLFAVLSFLSNLPMPMLIPHRLFTRIRIRWPYHPATFNLSGWQPVHRRRIDQWQKPNSFLFLRLTSKRFSFKSKQWYQISISMPPVGQWLRWIQFHRRTISSPISSIKATRRSRRNRSAMNPIDTRRWNARGRRPSMIFRSFSAPIPIPWVISPINNANNPNRTSTTPKPFFYARFPPQIKVFSNKLSKRRTSISCPPSVNWRHAWV